MNPISDKNRKICAPLIANILLVISPHNASGQPAQADSPSNIECLERLEIPDYPPLPRSAQITAIQTVKVLLSDQATVQNVTLVFQYELREDDKQSLFAFEPPNHFSIRAGPFYIQPEVSVH